MQRVETRPDQEVEEDEDQYLVEVTDETVLRQAPQEQQLETAR